MSVCLSWAPNWSIVMPWYSEHRSMPDLAWRIFTCAKESLSEEKYVEEISCDRFKKDIINLIIQRIFALALNKITANGFLL